MRTIYKLSVTDENVGSIQSQLFKHGYTWRDGSKKEKEIEHGYIYACPKRKQLSVSFSYLGGDFVEPISLEGLFKI